MANARTPAVVAAIAVAVLAVVALALGPPQMETPGWMTGDGEAVPQPEVTRNITDSSEPVQPRATDEPDIDSDTAVPWPLLIGLAALAIMAWLAYRFRNRLSPVLRRRQRRRTIGHDLDEVTEPDFHVAAREARQFLTRSSVPGHEAVISAWLTLETTAAESGIARGTAQTPSEFTARLLATQHADPEATGRLLALYHRARFAADPRLSQADVDAAVTALDTIIGSIVRPQAAATESGSNDTDPHNDGAASPNERQDR